MRLIPSDDDLATDFELISERDDGAGPRVRHQRISSVPWKGMAEMLIGPSLLSLIPIPEIIGAEIIFVGTEPFQLQWIEQGEPVSFRWVDDG